MYSLLKDLHLQWVEMSYLGGLGEKDSRPPVLYGLERVAEGRTEDDFHLASSGLSCVGNNTNKRDHKREEDTLQ